MLNNQIVITISGGCLTGVFSDLPGVKLVVVDYDNLEGCGCELDDDAGEVCEHVLSFEEYTAPLKDAGAGILEAINYKSADESAAKGENNANS